MCGLFLRRPETKPSTEFDRYQVCLFDETTSTSGPDHTTRGKDKETPPRLCTLPQVGLDSTSYGPLPLDPRADSPRPNPSRRTSPCAPSNVTRTRPFRVYRHKIPVGIKIHFQFKPELKVVVACTGSVQWWLGEIPMTARYTW